MAGMNCVVANLTSPWAWGIIALILLLFFGRRLPGVARNLGQGINEFKKGLSEGSTATRVEDPADRKPLLDDPTRPEAPPRVEATRPREKTHIDETSV